jgi:hypothetical protein
VALEAALLHGQVLCGCGCGERILPGEMEREHDPALELRDYDDATRTYTPDANDPQFIKLWRSDCHRKKTNGPGGERRITTAGSDNHKARKILKLAEKRAAHLAAMKSKERGKKSTRKGGGRRWPRKQ